MNKELIEWYIRNKNKRWKLYYDTTEIEKLEVL